MSLWQSVGRSRRVVVLTPLIIVANALLIWTLENTDIVAFATVFLAALVLVSGTFWMTRSVSNRETQPIRQVGFSDNRDDRRDHRKAA
jgi:hypothetical protein